MTDEYVELILKWRPSVDVDYARKWLESHDFVVTPMKAGAALLGTRRQIEKTFSTSLRDAQPPIDLPIPDELRKYVESVTFPKPRSYQT